MTTDPTPRCCVCGTSDLRRPVARAGLGDLDGAPVLHACSPECAARPPFATRAADPIVEAVRTDLLARSAVGMLKYGVPLTRSDTDLLGWLLHAYHEGLDQCLYLRRAIQDLTDRGIQAAAAAEAETEAGSTPDATP